jgi:hypothetical protein
VSRTCIIGPILFDMTVNTEGYMKVFQEFCAQLTEEPRQVFLPAGWGDVPCFSDVPAANSQRLLRGTHG